MEQQSPDLDWSQKMLDRDHACLSHLYTSLRKTEQNVLLLYYAEELTMQEIAEVLDLHVDTVEVLIGRIRVLARRLINDDQTASRAVVHAYKPKVLPRTAMV